MTRFAFALAATVSAFALASAAQAADLIIDEPAPVGVVDVSGNWDGVFIGVFAGYGWGTGEFEGAPGDWDLTGWLIGVDVGANFTVTDGIVAGVVADIAWSDISDTNFGIDYSIDWVASLRGRLGFDGGSFLPYLTAGLAVAGATIDAAPPSESNTHVGWTVGAGVEFAVTEDLSIDLLYRYSDYGSVSYGTFGGADIDFNTHTVQAGLHWNF